MMENQIVYSDLPLLNGDIFENICRLMNYGAEKIELMMDGEHWDHLGHRFERIGKQLKQLPVSFSVHPPAWDMNLTSEMRSVREATFTEYKKAIEFASIIGASHVVIHPGFCYHPSFNKKLAKKRAYEYIKELCNVAKPLGVMLAVENVGYGGTGLYTQEEFVTLLDDIDPVAGYLVDIGHAYLDHWDIPGVIEAVKDRLIALHIHDNNGTNDDHLPIGRGTIDLKKIIEVINKAGIDCELILEYALGTQLRELQTGKSFLRQIISLAV